jgi:hypothetical protein
MKMALSLILSALVLAPAAVLAQKPQSNVSVTSEPGKATAVSTVEATATVSAIDKATRTVTLKTTDGKSHDIVASEEVRNFDQIKVGDTVVVRYAEALTLSLKKPDAKGTTTETMAGARAKQGDKPAAAVGREVTVLAEVTALDPKASTITLKGPKGKSVDLKVQNPDQFKVVKVGDKVEAVYTEALAVSVTPKK